MSISTCIFPDISDVVKIWWYYGVMDLEIDADNDHSKSCFWAYQIKFPFISADFEPDPYYNDECTFYLFIQHGLRNLVLIPKLINV